MEVIDTILKKIYYGPSARRGLVVVDLQNNVKRWPRGVHEYDFQRARVLMGVRWVVENYYEPF